MTTGGQNRLDGGTHGPEADRAGVIAGLDGHPVAGLMRER